MKVGILTYHRSHNYGAFLQAYSLSHKIDCMEGISCEIVNYNLAKEDNAYKKRKWKRPIYLVNYLRQDKMFEKSQTEQMLSGQLELDDNWTNILAEAEKKYDVVIVGSDEIWRIASRGFPNVYWLPGKHHFVKMSYAASGRNPETKLTEQVKCAMQDLYADFRYIGVRDEITKEQIQSLSDQAKLQVRRNCDPVFFYDRFKPKNQLKAEICSKWNLDIRKKLVAVFYDRPEIITRMRKLLGKEYCFVCITRPMWNADKNLTAISPFEWVDVIGGCDFLITAYFHGMLFAVNQDTPFVAVDRRANRQQLATSKLYDFLHYSRMEERYSIAAELTDADWVKIAERIKKESNEAADFHATRTEQKNLFTSFKESLQSIEL